MDKWMKTTTFLHSLLICVLLAASGIAGAQDVPGSRSLKLATTTSTYDSGLLDAILPDFEAVPRLPRLDHAAARVSDSDVGSDGDVKGDGLVPRPCQPTFADEFPLGREAGDLVALARMTSYHGDDRFSAV